ncbi:MAG: hypothetical protein Q7S47_03045 [bacterium]|nr:hypothetical protein [bacterium]
MDKKEKRGGARNGAGRPLKQSTLYAQQFRDALAAHIDKKKDEYIAAWEALALGYKVLTRNERGEDEIAYLKPPDVRALQTITDRAFGRPDQPIQHEADIEIDLSIPDVAKNYRPKLLKR